MPKRGRDAASVAPTVLLPLCNGTVYPGDELCRLSALPNEFSLLVGVGVVREGVDVLRSSRVGVLRFEASASKIWVESDVRRYVPAVGEHVIGIVESRHADEYRLHIGGAASAALPVLAFDGATKRNRPHLEVGALVYCRITVAHRDMEPEVTCASPPGVGAKDWVTRESIFGELQGGQVFDCPPLLCRRLMGLDETAPVLDALGGLASFELAVGANGRVWLSSSSAAMVVLAQAAILRSQGVADEDHGRLVEELAASFDIAPNTEQAA